MKPRSILVVLLVATLGCSAQMSTTPGPAAGGGAAASSSSAASDDLENLEITTPESQTTSTRILSAHGTFDPSAHDHDHRLEFELTEQMTYAVHIAFKPFVGDMWCINPLTEVTNPTDSKMFASFNAAFFDAEGQLVGCCQQDIEMEPASGPTQLGSLVLRGSQEALQNASEFKIVIYESDKQIGSEPIDAASTADLVGRNGDLVSKLKELGSSTTSTDNGNQLRLKAAITFEDPQEKSRNTHLKVKGKAEYGLYLDARHRPVTIMKMNKENETYDRWEVAAEFDPRKRVSGVSAETHFALFDGEGKLIACVGAPSVDQLVAPEDLLLSSKELDMVAYETVQD